MVGRRRWISLALAILVGMSIAAAGGLWIMPDRATDAAGGADVIWMSPEEGSAKRSTGAAYSAR